MAREYFPAYHSYLEIMEELTDAEKGRLFTACLLYSKTGEAPELSGNERYLFPAFRSQIDRDNAEYAKKCATNRRNGELSGKRTGANAPERPPFAPERPPNAPQGKGEGKGKGKGKGEGNSPSGSITRFAPPDLAEVAAYCRERGNCVDPQRFVDFYASKGWLVGKSPMKDWRAAVRNWERGETTPRRRSFAEIAAEMGEEA